MKATLTFTLPEEDSEFQAAVHGIDYKIIISDLEDYIGAMMEDDDACDVRYNTCKDILGQIAMLAEQYAVELC